jgi:LysM repeat protein
MPPGPRRSASARKPGRSSEMATTDDAPARGHAVQPAEAPAAAGMIGAMPARSPARFLAPLALVIFAVALVTVLSSSSPSDPAPNRTGGSSGSGSGAATATPTATPRSTTKGRRTYTVRSGDTPSGIAEKTGVPLSQILDLNPDLDPQTLSPGTKLRLRR